jgi:putative DNA methylase
MRSAMKNVYEVSNIEPTTIYYAYKQREAGDQERAFLSTGWAAFLQAVYDTGFMLDATWALRVNNPGRKAAQGTNALASAVVLACRKRPKSAPVITRAAFLRELERELPAAVKLLQTGNIAPVDLAQASIGPGMAIFSRYTLVLNADDTPMTVKAALEDINAALDAFLSERDVEYDAYTRFAITWFEQSGMAAGPYGTAETLATARGISVGGVRATGIVESGGGKVRLKRREEMGGGADDTVWSSTQQLIHQLMDGSEGDAAEVLASLGHRAEAAKDLAYRLCRICERNKWAEEGFAYNALVASWPRLIEQAKTFIPEPPQGSFGL